MVELAGVERTVVFLEQGHGAYDLASHGLAVEEAYTSLNAALVMDADARELADLRTAGVITCYGDERAITITHSDRPYELATGVGPQDVAQGWGYRRVHAAEANARGLTGEGVKVGILDMGIDASHPYLIDAYRGFTDLVYDKPDPYDDHGHGTHVAGIVHTIAPEAELYSYKVVTGKGDDGFSVALRGLDKAVADGMDVVNMSFGMETAEDFEGRPKAEVDRLINEACSRVYDAGVFLVASAGNARETADPATGLSRTSPGSCPDVFTAGASWEDKDRLYNSTNLGFDIVAPGVDILSPVPGGYTTWTGTSMSAPLVAGAVAAIKSQYNGLSNDEIKEVLLSSGHEAASNVLRPWQSLTIEYRVLDLEAAADLLDERA
ncbi:MAG: S8 family serine peptidase [Candidatus Undinarchaeales archaeon]|jgi:subtilisin|nr:S8 family serine peptidase [Candidatus Undinarchaeales archaeon]MDP7492270.1 S8 family serine peptidase [Candidatus Undinarchaeales archaeon]